MTEREPGVEHKETRKFNIEFALASEAGKNRFGVVGVNEDHVFADPDRNIYAVLDGLGGHDFGERASGIVSQTILDYYKDQGASAEAKDARTQALEAANLAQSRLEGLNSEGHTNMGTTLSLVKLQEQEGKMRAIILNIGDSRVYRYRNDSLECLTLDDGVLRRYFADPKAAKRAQDDIANAEAPDDVSGETRAIYDFYMANRNVITQSVGSKGGVRPNIMETELEPDDILLILSDGIHDQLTTREIQKQMEISDVNALSRALIEKAKEKFATHSPRTKKHLDDMGVAVIKIK